MLNWLAMENFTRHANASNNQASTASQSIAVFLPALNILLSITASLGNALIVFVLHKVSSVHPPTKLLFRCLAVTDLCVGLIVQPLYVIIFLDIFAAVIAINPNITHFVIEIQRALSFALCGVSVFTSTAISVDRFLALKMGVRYRQVVSLRRVRSAITCFWLIGVLGGLVSCLLSVLIAYTTGVTFTVLCVVISVFFYSKIYLRLQQHQTQVEHVHQGQPNRQGNPLIITQFKKTVYSIAWVQLAMVVCYVPYIVSSIIIRTVDGWRGVSAEIFRASTVTLLYLNSSLNPILYCWKITEVRQGVKDTVKQFCCRPVNPRIITD